MNLESLPLFPQFMRVLCSYRISSFQVSDILAKVILLGVENNNINYQNVYRLVQRLVKKGYLIRERSDSDRKIVVIRLTDSGEGIMYEFKNMIFKIY
jgi:DNA-binding PadR family transcriptional regulator